MAVLSQLTQGLMLSLWTHANLRSILLVGCVLLLTYWFMSSRGWPNCPPGPWGWPVLGNLLSLRQYPFKTLEALGRKYGDVFRVKMGVRNVVVLNSYAAIREALVKKAADFSSRPPTYSLQDDMIEDKKYGLIFLPDGPIFKQQRKFAISSLRDFGFGKRSMEGKVSAEADKLAAQIFETGGESFDPRTMIQSAVANVIFSIVVGEPFDLNDPKFQNFLSILNRDPGSYGSLPNFIPLTKHLPAVKRQLKAGEEIMRKLWMFYGEFITKHKAMFDDSDIRDFVDAFLSEMKKREDEEGTSFTDKQLEQTIDGLLQAGTDTTATTLRWALLYIMLYPDVQQKVQHEMDTAVGRDKLPSLADREQLPYTQAVIAEVLRIRPVGAIAIPHATLHDTTLRGYDIPANTMVLPNLWAVLHDPGQYPEPDVFKPDRFLDGSGQFVKPATFIPFSTGRRACLGEHLARMELFIFFTHLMYHFTFTLPEGASTPSAIGTGGFLLKPFTFQTCATTRK